MVLLAWVGGWVEGLVVGDGGYGGGRVYGGWKAIGRVLGLNRGGHTGWRGCCDEIINVGERIVAW